MSEVLSRTLQHGDFDSVFREVEQRIRNFTPNFIKKDSSLNCPHE